ncbi:hypothetical protein [Flavobacterium sp. 3HN19-14]|uniref:hypothetical protein n=1 Tax=Flavobacterium sp. 3HN19-14 TaxID=3448133 RepID=UPI003EDFD137
MAYPIKGTSLYDEIENDIIVQPDWETSTDREIDFRRNYSRKYYDYAVSKVVNEVELHRESIRENKNRLKILKLKTKSVLAGAMMSISK